MARCVFSLLVLWIVSSALPVPAAQTLVIPGSGDSQKLLRALVRAFEVSHPGTAIEIPESIGSSGGIKNVVTDNAELARVARPLNESERQAGLEYRAFAFSPVVFAAHLK